MHGKHRRSQTRRAPRSRLTRKQGPSPVSPERDLTAPGRSGTGAWRSATSAPWVNLDAISVKGLAWLGIPAGDYAAGPVLRRDPGPELMTLMWAAICGYHAEPKFPGVLTDDELRAIDVPVLLVTGARSALLTPVEARARGSLMPHAEVAIVPGSHGGFNRIDELNDRIAAFIQAHATGRQAAADTG